MSNKELMFAVGALTALGLSRAHALTVAERILVPGAKLGAGDAEYLRLVRKAQGVFVNGMSGQRNATSPRWRDAN